jgi:Janus/Ocnus family (Ocnus)
MTQTVILVYPAAGGPPDAAEYRGKFVQLVLDGKQYLVFASAELHRFHNQILAHFAADRNIVHRWIDDQTLKTESAELAVVGGGKFRVNTQNKTMELWDNSQAYGRFDARGLAEAIASAGHPWSGFDIRIA